MSYVCLMIIGHGLYPTYYSNEVINLFQNNTKSNLFSITFSPAGETCSYGPNLLHKLKFALSNMLLGQLGNEKDEDSKNDLFAHIVSQAELDVRGITYQDITWTGDFNTNIQFAGRQYSGNNYLEKVFSAGNGIICGAFVIDTNIKIYETESTTFQVGNSTNLSDIVEKFNGVDKIYILDTTCSVVLNPEGTMYLTYNSEGDIDRRATRQWSREINKHMPPINTNVYRGGKRRKSKKSKKNKKRRKKKKNKKIDLYKKEIII